MNGATLLLLLRLASPSLPVGGFSYSEGIEGAVESGRVGSEAQVLEWLRDQLHLGLSRSDLPVVAGALLGWRAGDFDRVAALNLWFATTRETSEMRQQTEQMARSLSQWLHNRAGSEPRLAMLDALTPSPTWPVAFALAAALTDATPADTAFAFAAGWAENLVQAAMKSVPLGQLAGQRILDALALEIPAAVDTARDHAFHDMQAFTPMLAILSSQHEVQYSRLFRS